jgi:hypothetical protein
MFNGPRRYQPSKAYKMAVIQDYAQVMPDLVLMDGPCIASVLWHNDLHSDNIFVNEDDPTEITGIIDWQGAHLSPALFHVHLLFLIEYDGLILEGFEQPQLADNFAELDQAAKENAQKLVIAQRVWLLYQIFFQKQAPDLIRILHYRDTLPCQIMTSVRCTFDNGEPYTQSLLAQLANPETWKTMTKNNSQQPVEVLCPLTFSNQEFTKQREELAKWERCIKIKARVIREVEAYISWDGAVSPEDYDIYAERLENARANFLEAEPKTPQEQEQWAFA